MGQEKGQGNVHLVQWLSKPCDAVLHRVKLPPIRKAAGGSGALVPYACVPWVGREGLGEAHVLCVMARQVAPWPSLPGGVPTFKHFKGGLHGVICWHISNRGRLITSPSLNVTAATGGQGRSRHFAPTLQGCQGLNLCPEMRLFARSISNFQGAES
jgi:hypothetical protein